MTIVVVYGVQPSEINNYKNLANSHNMKDNFTSTDYQYKIISNAITPCMPNLEAQNITTPKNIEEIAWKKNYCLKFSDFIGVPDKNPRIVAWTQYLARYYYYIETNNSTREFTFKDIRVVAYFDKEKSWVKDLSHYDNLTKRYVLRHEQGHFDNAEQFARNTEKSMKFELTQKDFPIISRTGNLQIDAQNTANNLISSAWNKISPNLNISDSSYENDTNYENYYEQIKYDAIFDKLRK